MHHSDRKIIISWNLKESFKIAAIRPPVGKTTNKPTDVLNNSPPTVYLSSGQGLGQIISHTLPLL